MWVKRLILEPLDKPWKIIPQYYLKRIGGVSGIRSNFTCKFLPKHLPPFYRQCLDAWAKFQKYEPETENQINCQPVINNVKLKYAQNYEFVTFLQTHNIQFLPDIFHKGNIKELSTFTNAIEYYRFLCLGWLSLNVFQNNGCM